MHRSSSDTIASPKRRDRSCDSAKSFTSARFSKALQSPFFLERYPRYAEIQKYLRLLVRRYSSVMRVEKLGKTVQGRTIEMVVLQRGNNYTHGKRGMLLEAGIHAREWLTHTTALYFIYFVLNNQYLLNYMDYYIVPCLNPDGYEYSHIAGNRLWRKNMNTNGRECEEHWGVDLNRNFPFEYGHDYGSSANTEHVKHRGAHSLSEPESRCLSDFLKKHGKQIHLYIALHCYGNLIMHPWGYTTDKLDDEAELNACGKAAAIAINEVNKKRRFIVGSVSKTLNLSSGNSVDYARGIHKVKFSYVMELERGGISGFDAPTFKIKTVAAEAVAGIHAMILYVHDYYAKESEKEIERLSKRTMTCSDRPTSYSARCLHKGNMKCR